MATVRLYVKAVYEGDKGEAIVAERRRGPVDANFETVNKELIAYGQIDAGDALLEVLHKAGIRPKPEEGGEDHDLDRGGSSPSGPGATQPGEGGERPGR